MEAIMDPTALAEYLSIFLGTILGLVQGCFGGLSKIIPIGLMGVKMSKAFNQVYGPFLGFPGTCLRIIIGLGEACAGIGIMLGVWGDAFAAFDEELSNLVRALCIVAGSALMVVGFVGGMMHYYVDAAPCTPPTILGCISLVFTLLRVFAVRNGVQRPAQFAKAHLFGAHCDEKDRRNWFRQTNL